MAIVAEPYVRKPSRAEARSGRKIQSLYGTAKQATEKVGIGFQKHTAGAKARRNFNVLRHD
jgi:hypothetical protein